MSAPTCSVHYESQANPVAAFRRLRAARRNYPSLPRLAGQNQQQIDDLRHLTTSELVAAIAQTGPRAIRAVENPSLDPPPGSATNLP